MASNVSSTSRSIGDIIIGIEASPAIVAPHFLGIPLTLDILSSFAVPQVIRLMTTPGIAIEASICQRKTSPAWRIVRWTVDLVDAGDGVCGDVRII